VFCSGFHTFWMMSNRKCSKLAVTNFAMFQFFGSRCSLRRNIDISNFALWRSAYSLRLTLRVVSYRMLSAVEHDSKNSLAKISIKVVWLCLTFTMAGKERQYEPNFNAFFTHPSHSNVKINHNFDKCGNLKQGPYTIENRHNKYGDSWSCIVESFLGSCRD